MPGKGSGKGGGERSMRASQSEGALLNTTSPGGSQQASAPSSTFVDPLAGAKALQSQTALLLSKVHLLYSGGHYEEALQVSQRVYELDAFRTDNLLLLGAIHFQLRNFSESIFYNQQCVRVDPNFAEGYSNLGNALKELGDVKAAVQFYLKAIKLKPRFCDAYNNLASSYVQLGQMAEAVETYQMALVLNPALVDAHSNLGNLYKAQGDLDAAKRCYLEAIRIKPDFAVAWSNLAGVFKDEGQLATAIAYYKEAIRLCPEFADAHSNLGNALKDQGLLDEAMGCYKASVALRPDFAIAHGNLGSCQFELGDVSGAIKSFKYAIQLEPNFPDAFNNLGNAYKQLGRLDDSIQAYRTALRLKPDHPHAYNNLGNAMKDAGLVKEALHCYVTAIRLLPLFAAAHSNLASVLKEQGKLQQAISHYQEAISIDPLFADAYSNLGNAYKDAGQVDEAIKCYITALKIRPTFPDALTNMAAAYKDAGNYVDAAAFYRQALEQNPDHIEAYANLVHTQTILCDWSERDEAFGKLAAVVSLQLRRPPSAPVCCVQPFHTLAYPLSLDEMQQIACQYAEKARNSVMLTETHFTVRGRPKSARLRVGFVSSDFGNHPLGQLTSSVYGLFDRSLFHVVCYATTPSDMSLHRQYIEATAETFKDISLLSAGDAAQLIYNDDVHVLVNLNGFTRGARNEIFALRPAPLQLSFLGFCGTMGARYMDYLVADATVVPKHLRPFYTEKILSLPHCYLVTDHKQSARSAVDQDATGAALPTRAQYGIPEDKFVFCNFSQVGSLLSRASLSRLSRFAVGCVACRELKAFARPLS